MQFVKKININVEEFLERELFDNPIGYGFNDDELYLGELDMSAQVQFLKEAKEVVEKMIDIRVKKLEKSLDKKEKISYN